MPISKFLSKITHTLLNDAYLDFKSRYPNEEPHIRVICSRHHRLVVADPKFNEPWRKHFISEEKGKVILESKPINQEIILEKKIKTVKVDPNKPKPINIESSDRAIREKSKKRQEDRETLIEERVEYEKIDLTMHNADYVVDGRDRPYDGSILLTSQDRVELIGVSSTKPIDAITMIDQPINLTYENLMTAIEQSKQIYEDIKNNVNKVKEVSDKYTQCTFSPNRVETGSQTSKGQYLWNILKIKYKLARSVIKKRRIIHNNMIRLAKELTKKERKIQDNYNEFIKDMEAKYSQSNIKSKEMIEIEEKVKSNLAGNKSVKEICDSYFIMQKKLNDLKSRITPILKTHTKLKFKDLTMEYGFVGSLYHVIKYFDDTFDDPEDYLPSDDD